MDARIPDDVSVVMKIYHWNTNAIRSGSPSVWLDSEKKIVLDFEETGELVRVTMTKEEFLKFNKQCSNTFSEVIRG